MVFVLPFLGLVAVFASLSGSLAQNVDMPPVATSTVVPGRYIVEFDSSSDMTAAGYSKRDALPHDGIYNHWRKRGISFNLNLEYTTPDIFVGASLSLASDNDLATLANTNGVVGIYPVHSIVFPDVMASDTASWVSTAQKRGLVNSVLGDLGLGNNAVSNGGNTSVSGNSTTISSNSTTISSNSTVSSGNATTNATINGGLQPAVKVKSTMTTTTSTTSSTSSTSSSTAPAAAQTSPFGQTGFSVLPQIQADRVQAAGNKGAGIKIGIIDGGVDYTRPALGGCFGSGCKVAGGYDFVGDNYNGSNTPVPDSNPLDICYSHGTIVAGIIGANDNIYGVPGVAPAASLYSYRVFGCNGHSSNDLIIQGLERAYNDNMDVINLSIGETSGWTEGILNVVSSRLVAKGTVIVASAGNEGQIGAFYAYSPASGKGVVNMGSTDNAIFPAFRATVSTGHAPITYFSFQPFTLTPFPVQANTFYPLYSYSNTTTGSNGCTVPAGTPKLTGKIVIATLDGCPVSQKAMYAFLAGAAGIIVINDPATVPYFRFFPLTNYGMISPSDGAYLLQQIAAGNNPALSFAFSPVAVPNTFSGNITTFFSEIGPTNDLFMAPSLLAPGHYIINVTPYNPALYFYNWSISDGTSWSSAYGSGSAALYLAAKGTNNVSPADVKSAFEMTALRVPVSVNDSSLESVAAQGSGRLQLFDAIHVGVSVSPTELLLNDSVYFQGIQQLTIKNTGSQFRTYNLKHVAAGTETTIKPNSNQSFDEPVPQVSNAASVTIIPSTLFLFPGTTGIVFLKFSPPTGLSAQQLPVYSGWIDIQAQGASDRVQVPYLGVAASMKALPVLDTSTFATNYTLPAVKNGQGQVQSSPETYTFKGTDFPTVIYRLVGGSPVLLIDLVRANASLGFTPTYHAKRALTLDPAHDQGSRRSQRKRRSPLDPRRLLDVNIGISVSGSGSGGLLNILCLITNYPTCSNTGTGTFQKVPIVGNLFEADYQPRNTDNSDFDNALDSSFALNRANFTNGTIIPNGDYRFLLRALHITGDMRNEADYESWLSQPFTVAQ